MDINTSPLFKVSADLIKNHYTEGCIMEIGAGEYSSPYFNNIAKSCGIKMHSIDTSKIRFFLPEDDIQKNHHESGENFLRNFDEKIFFCYMDNYDWLNYWEHPEPIYHGITKEKSELIHLEQSMLLFPKTTGYILFDDTGVNKDYEISPQEIMLNKDKLSFYGKGAKAVPYLLSMGMTIIGYSANRHHGGFNGEHDQILLKRHYVNTNR
jgi:hypothetical protein